MSLLLLAASEPNSFIQLNYEGNRWRRTRWHIYLLVYDFVRFHHNYLRDTISWECIVEDDCVRSCLIELQSFSVEQAVYRNQYTVSWCLFHFFSYVLQHTVSWCTFHFFCLYHARRGLVRSSSIGSWWFLFMGLTAIKEYRLSVPAKILSSRYHSWICDGV